MGDEPNAAESDVLWDLKRRVRDILTSYPFHGKKCEFRVTLPPEKAAVVRKHLGTTLKPDAVRVSTPGFVCSLAGVWILEAQG